MNPGESVPLPGIKSVRFAFAEGSTLTEKVGLLAKPLLLKTCTQ